MTNVMTLWAHVRNITHKPADHPLGFAVAVSGALMQLMTYGIENSLSTFFSDMQQDATLNYPSATTLSFSSSLTFGVSSVFGILAGFLTDRLPPRLILATSTLMLFLALWLSSSFAHSGVGFIFSYSLLASLSSAFMVSPGAIATSSWFKRRIGLAQGINFCGGGVGTMIIPPVLGKWLGLYGWRKTFRLASCFCAIGIVAATLSCRRSRSEDSDDDDERHDMHDGDGDNDPVRDDTAAANTTTTALVAGATSSADAYGARVHAGDEEERYTYGLHTTDVTPTDEPFSPKNKHDDEAAAVAKASKAAVDASATTATRLVFASAHDELMHAVHTRRLTLRETLRVFVTIEFLSNFVMLVLYSWAFYGLIYVTVPLVSSMGKPGTVYADLEPIPVDKASTVLVFWGSFQVVGSVLVGALASFTADAFAYALCAGVGGVATGLLLFCRTYAAFAACTSVIGFCTAGMFGVMPALIARDLYGPNLGLYMSCVFAGTMVGGISSPPIHAQLQTHNHGNYSYGCVFNSVFMTLPGIICYVCLWRDKQGLPARLWRRIAARCTRNATTDA